MSEPDDRNGQEGFLGRWSRRKRAVAAETPVALPAPAAAEPDERPRDPETGEPLDEALIRSLPDIAEIAPGADISAFMQRGVPEALRRQALRALWSADPAIRDFVSPALDYAYDYNAPGGAPGYGPITESDIAQAREFVSKLFSDTTPKTDETGKAELTQGDGDMESQGADRSGGDDARMSAPLHVALHTENASDGTENTVKRAESDQFAAKTPQFAEEPVVQRTAEDGAESRSTGIQSVESRPIRRRGGGATPI